MTKERAGYAPAVVQQEMGTLEVLDGVFCAIAERAVSQVSGVAMVGRSGTGLFGLGSRAEAVEVERGAGEVALSLHITVRYDCCIPEMMGQLRERLTEAIETTTGYKVRAIHVTVDHILPPVPSRPGPADEKVPELPAGAPEAPQAERDADQIPDIPPVPGTQ